jgi:hypothetical protein
MAEGTNDIQSAPDAIELGIDAGDTYSNKLSEIKTDLDDEQGAGLGTMVGAQYELTYAETKYQVDKGIPGKWIGVQKGISDEIKRTTQ